MSKATNQTVIAHMAGRAEQCRRLAKAINDDRARTSLLQMAEEIDADIRRLESGEGADGEEAGGEEFGGDQARGPGAS